MISLQRLVMILSVCIYVASGISLRRRLSRKVFKGDKGMPSRVESLLFVGESYASEDRSVFQTAMSELHAHEKQVNSCK